MSIKRTATTELNHDNWDQEDPADNDEMGTYKVASKDVLEKRVIRTAKRRSQASGDEPKKSVFSGFGGFNKSQPSSFDFLANLTNGNKSTNGASTKSEAAVTSSLFSSKPAASTGLFGAPTTCFGTSPLQNSSLFISSAKTEIPAMTFTASKADSTSTDSAFKMQSVSSSADTKPSPQVSSTIFGVSSTSANKKPLTSTNSFKQPVSSTSTAIQNSSGTASQSRSNNTESSDEPETEKDKARNKYYSKLKGLNESVVSWISKHVEKTPLCFLTPIFKDYENYLKDIKEEYDAAKEELENKTNSVPSQNKSNSKPTSESTVSPFLSGAPSTAISSSPNKTTMTTPFKAFSFGITSTAAITPSSSPFSTNSTNTTTSLGITSTPVEKLTQSVFASNTGSPPTKFTFGIVNPSVSTTTNSSPFANTASSTPTKPIFGMTPSATSTTDASKVTATASAPFSFGLGSNKPFSFGSQVQQSTAPPKTDENEEDEPPKVEYTPVVEENSVFDKRCKIFVKKDGNFADKGVGTLYIKKIDESGKHQLLVRANTNLGTILLNLILSSAIPMQRMGKNNVMLVCIPTPDAKPPPTPILVRVKTGEEADDLLETFNKYKS